MKNDYFLKSLFDCLELLGREGQGALSRRGIAFDPFHKGFHFEPDFFFFLRCALAAKDTIPLRGEPPRLGERLSAFFAFFEIRKHAVDLEKPGFEISSEEVQVSTGFE